MIRIAIDGPAGAGKSTIARMCAKKLGIVYVDTGAMYRTIGYYIRSVGVDPQDAVAVKERLPEIKIEVRFSDGQQTVVLNGEELGDRIREPEMSMYASAVSAHPAVRTFLLDTQRELAQKNSVIMDGRDIGTVILPDAEVKVFLFASDAVRAKRRYDELIAKGLAVRYEDVYTEMLVRDQQDSARAIAPCVPAADAVLLDNSELTPEQCVDRIIALVEKVTDGRWPYEIR